jgi:hypothetical protein
MSHQCQCTIVSGKQCSRDASTKSNQDPKFCWERSAGHRQQHQKCQIPFSTQETHIAKKSPTPVLDELVESLKNEAKKKGKYATVKGVSTMNAPNKAIKVAPGPFKITPSNQSKYEKQFIYAAEAGHLDDVLRIIKSGINVQVNHDQALINAAKEGYLYIILLKKVSQKSE